MKPEVEKAKRNLRGRCYKQDIFKVENSSMFLVFSLQKWKCRIANGIRTQLLCLEAKDTDHWTIAVLLAKQAQRLYIEFFTLLALAGLDQHFKPLTKPALSATNKLIGSKALTPKKRWSH